MKPLARPNVLQMEPYQPGKPIEAVQRELGLTEVIKLASNENPLGASPRALEAIQAALSSVHLYPDGDAYTLRAALADFHQLPPDHFLFGNGSDEIIHYLGLAFLNPGDELIMGDPSFTRYEAAAYLNNAVLRKIPLTPDFRHDVPAMRDAVNERTKLIFIANPNNPTGTLTYHQEVEKLLQDLPESVLLILDEAYFEYVDHPDYPNGIDYVQQGLNVVAMRTFSKAYGLAGLRAGYAVARPELIDPMNRLREPFNLNALAQAACVAALQDQSHVQQTRKLNQASLRTFYQCCERLGLRYVPSYANFLLIDTARHARAVFDALLREGVITRSGEPLGLPQFIRVNTGTPDQNQRFVEAFEKVMARDVVSSV